MQKMLISDMWKAIGQQIIGFTIFQKEYYNIYWEVIVMMMLIVTEHLSSFSHCAQCFTFIILFSPLNNFEK